MKMKMKMAMAMKRPAAVLLLCCVILVTLTPPAAARTARQRRSDVAEDEFVLQIFSKDTEDCDDDKDSEPMYTVPVEKSKYRPCLPSHGSFSRDDHGIEFTELLVGFATTQWLWEKTPDCSDSMIGARYVGEGWVECDAITPFKVEGADHVYGHISMNSKQSDGTITVLLYGDADDEKCDGPALLEAEYNTCYPQHWTDGELSGPSWSIEGPFEIEGSYQCPGCGCGGGILEYRQDECVKQDGDFINKQQIGSIRFVRKSYWA